MKGTSLLLALGKGTLQRFDVELRPDAPPLLHPASGMSVQHIIEVTCMEAAQQLQRL